MVKVDPNSSSKGTVGPLFTQMEPTEDNDPSFL